jgi:hypothetical protein
MDTRVAELGQAVMTRLTPNTVARRKARSPRFASIGWGVPWEYAGTEDDNWLTRTLEPVLSDIETIVEAALKRI